MYCKNCGCAVNENAAACLNCGADPKKGNKYCGNCGKEIQENQVVCLSCGCQVSNGKNSAGKSGFDDFVRIREGKIISGVCTGLANKWNTNPWLIRLAFLLLPVWPVWIVIYIILSNKPIE